jgi:glutamate--cysteine ligase
MQTAAQINVTNISDILSKLDNEALCNWFDSKSQNRQPVFYSSVDIRNFGVKIAPVDTNIFPAGWNNLSEPAKQKAIDAVKQYFIKYYPSAKSAAILAENFSRNKFYWENISVLRSLIEQAGIAVKIYSDDATTAQEANVAHTDYNFSEDVVILNRDFTSGIPGKLSGVTKPIIPSPSLGWHNRRKTAHFDAYTKIAGEFAAKFEFDPWLISSYHANCGKVNFKEKQGLECVALNIEKTLHKIRAKYAEYNISSEPYVFIKANSGTFGMGIMTARDGNEVFEMNKKLRNKMDVIKEGVQSTEVIIQEGLPTIDKVSGKPAEPFVYLIGGKPVGAILRINSTRDEFGNLNSSGMEFEKMECSEIEGPCDFSPLGIIARLASLATLDERY